MRVIFQAIFMLVVLAGAVIAWDAGHFFSQSLVQGEPQTIQVAPGSSFDAISHMLVARGLFDTPRQGKYFSGYARLKGVTQKVHSGEYEVQSGTTPLSLLRAMVDGRTVQHQLTIVEGWRFSQLRDALAKHEAIAHTLTDKTDAQIMAALGHADQHPEGRFLPDTYKFPRGTTDVAFLRRAYQAMQAVLAQEWPKRDEDMPLASPYEALILASIVERETAVPAERGQIAGVFTRRLKIGMPLQTDPTVIYGVPEFDGNLRRRDLTRDTPYNTYMRRGLPPTPIALPGRAAIHASLHPAPGDALYFVSRGDGSHVFSPNLEAHNAAVRKYQLNQ